MVARAWTPAFAGMTGGRTLRGAGHPLRLSRGRGAPLLFKGGDFGLTDVPAHPASIRL
jgi:hypothetical protein